MFRFEYDENKSALNFQKHGINFNDAKKLWEDPDLIEIQAKTIMKKDIWPLAK